MKYKNILVTGGRGFIGFNALQLWTKMFPDCKFTCIDASTYADYFMHAEKDEWLEQNSVKHYIVKLGQKNEYYLFKNIVIDNKIDLIVHFAAESHVDNSIKDPTIFFQSNVLGTVDVLNIAKELGLRVHIVSTDEVYGPTTPESWGSELSIAPSSPYSSSKASADLIAMSYFKTFGTQVTISRCSNNFGRYQHDEKLIGTVIRNAMQGNEIPVYGNGEQRRHWIHVDEHNKAIVDIIEKGECGKIYNIAPPKESWISNLELVEFILKIVGNKQAAVKHVTDRPAHDVSYFMKGTEFCQRTRDWKEDMQSVVEWYIVRSSR